MSVRQGTVYDISQLLHRAKSLLVLLRFKEVVEVCCEALELSLKGNDNLHFSQELHRKSDQWTPFAVVGIQAYGELNQCQEAVKFATRVFGKFRMFPPEALELCICLLLKASMYREAGELAEDWLNCEGNYSHVKYLRIAEFYIRQILFPQGLHQKIKEFLESNQVVPSDQRQILFSFSRPFNHDKVESCNTSHEVPAPGSLSCKHGAAHRLLRVTAVVIQKLQSLCSVICLHQKTKILIRVVILLFFIYCLLSASSYQGVNKGSGIFILWQAVLNAWRALFSPC